METNILEKPQAFAVLRILNDKPGLTYTALGSVGGFRDKTKEARLAEFVAADLVEGRPAEWRGRPCTRYYLTQKGLMLMAAIDLIEKL